MKRLCFMLALAAPAVACAQEGAWTHYGRGVDRVPIVAGDADSTTLDAPAWTVETLPTLGAISVPTPSGPVSDGERVFFTADVGGAHRLVAVDLETGAPLWDAVIDPPFQDSWSSPAVDLENSTVLGASGAGLRAHDVATGALLWSTPLARSVVNASPLVTSDRGPGDRAFIVSEDGSFVTFNGGVLHAINVDPFDAATNPYQPGEIVWTLPLEAAATGASVAYANGLLYLSDAGDPFFGAPGSVRSIILSEPPTEFWRRDAASGGYFGGVSVSQGAVFAATYVFSGGTTAATLTKLDDAGGGLLWSVPCNRSSSVPVPMPDGHVLLSGGIDGFGTLPSVEVFEDNGSSATRTLFTIDDSPSLVVGGWTNLPAVLDTGDGLVAAVGTLPGSGALFGAYNELRLLDLSLPASDPGFVIDAFTGCGSTPIVAGGRLLSLGPTGLFAFELASETIPGDADGNGVVDLDDLYAWYQDPAAERDANGDGQVTTADAAFIEAIIRAGEIEDMTGGRR